jgi:hypothetical protein
MALRNKLILMVGGVAVLAAAGWFGWQQLSDSGAAPLPATPAAPKAKRRASMPKTAAPGPSAQAGPAALGPGAHAGPGAQADPAAPGAAAQPGTPANPDQIIDQVLSATGLGAQLDGLPEGVVAAVKEGFARQPPAVRALGKDFEKIVAESFTKEGFQRRVRDGLKASYDDKRLRALVSAASTPLAKKMTQLELAKPSQAELAAYVNSLTSKPIPPQRQALLQRLDDASNSSGLGTEIALASMRAMALGAAGSNPNAASEIDKAMEGQRPALTANVRKSSLMTMAFTYRTATDAELSEYVKLYESDHGKWFTSVVSAAIVAEFKSASGHVGEQLAALVKSKQPPASVVARAGKHPSAPAAAPEPGSAPADTPKPSLALRQGSQYPTKDLRSCLDLATTVEIIKCAEQGR